MKFFDEFGGMLEIGGIFPRVVAGAIAFPFDQILKFTAEYTRVKDFLNFIFFFVVDDLRGWWWGLCEAVFVPWAETIHVDDGIDV